MIRSPLVIGVGNLDRGDDAAGLLAVRQLETARTKELNDCSGLMEVWDGEPEVIVVDAMVSGGEPGSVRCFDPGIETLPTRAFPSTHAFGLAETIELARALGRLPDILAVYGIEGASFAPGEPLTPSVRQAVDRVANTISERLG